MIPHETDITVLHLDDDPSFCDIVSTFLENTNDRLTVRTATETSEAHEILATDEIDCVVSDYDMPRENGLEFLSRIRSNDVDCPFILFTGKGSEEIASDAISAGVTDYLQKESGTDQFELLANRIVNGVEKYRSERRMERSFDAIETSQEGISIIDSAGEYIYVNQAYADIFGYDPEEMIGQHWELTYPEENVDYVREGVVPEIPETGRWTGETVQVRRDGTRIIVDHSLATSGEHLVCTVQDITEDVERQQELREQRELFDLFIHSVAEYAVFMLDPNGNVVSWNPGAERIKGYTEAEILGEHFSIFYPGESRDTGVPSQLLEQAEAEGTATHEGWRVRKDGSKFWGDVTITAVCDEADELRGFGMVVRDRSDQHQFEERLAQLLKTAQRFTRAESKAEIAEISVESAVEILELPINACWLYDEAADVLRPAAASDRSDEVVGDLPVYEGDESLSWDAFVTGEVGVHGDLLDLDGFDASDTPIRSDLILPLGDHGVLNVGATEPDAFDEKDVTLSRILAVITEVSMDEVEYREQLETETEFIESALDALDDGFYVFEEDLTPVRWNRRVRELTGYSDAEIAEMEPLEFFEGEERATVADAITELIETGQVRAEAELSPKEGAPFPVEFRGSKLAYPGETGFAVIARDVTERNERERELERTNERLEEFASFVSHDLRNPLSVARGRLELAREDCESPHLADVERAHDRMATLIEDLLELARTGTTSLDVESVSLSSVVDQAWENVETAEATLVTETTRWIRADENRLQQLLENLLRNAVEHGGNDVTVTVGDLEDGFVVEDDGSGIPSGAREAVLEKGHSTSEAGTGFGLNIVEEIAKDHGWRLTITDSAAGGARFEFRAGDREPPEEPA